MSDHQVIVVSGGSRGLGKVIVERLLDGGHAVATFSRKPSPAVENWQQDEKLAPRFLYQSVDASDSEALRQFVQATKEQFGRIDALINNAGLAHDTVLPLMTDHEFDQMLDVNLRASLVLARECTRVMLLGKQGSIINISSIIASTGFSGLAGYAATKAGQIGMTRSLARELGPRNIRVNAIAPGYMETEMSEGLGERQRNQIIRRTPLGRLGQPEDIVPCIEFLLSPGASFITGQVFTIDGGSSI